MVILNWRFYLQELRGFWNVRKQVEFLKFTILRLPRWTASRPCRSAHFLRRVCLTVPLTIWQMKLKAFLLILWCGEIADVWPFFAQRSRRVHISTTHLQEKCSSRFGAAPLDPMQRGAGLRKKMNVPGYWLRRHIAGCLVIMFAVPFGAAAETRPQQAVAGQQAEGVPSAPAPSPATANPPQRQSTSVDRSAGSSPASDTAQAQTAGSTQQTGTTPPAAQQEQNNPTEPVGTAAAPYEKTTGVAASRPAGAVIAPAKQKRARSILIRVAVIVGAAAAIGTVVGLSSASPSKPH